MFRKSVKRPKNEDDYVPYRWVDMFQFVTTSKNESEEVPEYFVENELRNWINQKFLIDPPLKPKTY